MKWLDRFRRKETPITFSELEDVASIYIGGHVWVSMKTLQEEILPYLMEAAKENPEVPGEVLILALANALTEVDNETINIVFENQFGLDSK